MWTAIAAITGSLSGAAIFDVSAWKAAAMAGLTAAINFVLLIARQKANDGGGG